jgi:hypothetical protein
MRLQPNRDYVSDDVVQTPLEMAQRLVEHFKPEGKILEPCCGAGNFLRFLPEADWCELKKGRDFMEWSQPVDWIITNPPWSKIRSFLQHSMLWADDIVFLLTINHIWTKARLRDIKESGFGLREICLLEMPSTFPQSGFQLGAVHIQRHWQGDIRMSDLSVTATAKPKIRRRLLQSVNVS